MPPKRGHWQRKKEERSRSFAKRGRVGGWGDYGSNGPVKDDAGSQTKGDSPLYSAVPLKVARNVDTSPADGATPGAAAAGQGAKRDPRSPGNTRGGRKQQTRRVESVHAGSYAGELADLLSEERRQLLKERLEEDSRAARDKEDHDHQKIAPPPPVEGDGPEVASTSPVVGPNGEGGVASSTSKKRVALLIAYWGSDYQGLQINKGAKSIEAELELALYLAGSISKDNFGNPRKVSWSRSGRTDKGVHAAAQLISVKLTYPNDGEQQLLEAINSYLPEDIRALDIKRAPKSFDSRTRCSGRRYEYIMPTYVLAPKEHIAALFEEAVEWEKSQGGEKEATDITEKDAHGISAVMGGSVEGYAAKAVGEASSEAAATESAIGSAVLDSGTSTGVSSTVAPAVVESPIPSVDTSTSMATAAAKSGQSQSEGVQEEGVEGGGGGGIGSYGGDRGDDDDDDDDDDQSSQDQAEDDAMEARLRQAAVELSSPAVIRRVGEKLRGYRLPPDRVEELRETLKGFLGTKNYHNYTNHKQHSDPSCKRLITSFTAADPFENDGMEWVRLTVGGQSFIMHQIRKMVASSVDRVRGQSSEEDFTRSFFPVKMSLGIAPSDGLYLERPLYAPYNAHARRTDAHDRVLEWETGPAAEALEAFKKNKIHAGILEKEKVDYDFVAWLDRVTRYPCSY
ncbi:unnamed protein product [Scytosiphon promiscuus]